MSNIAAVMKEMIRQQLMTLHTCLICKVLNVYANDTAKVHPLTMVQTAAGEVRQHQALDGVPIADQVKNTIKVGSICIVVFAERDIAKSLSGEYALPSLARHHSLSDGLIIGTIGEVSGSTLPGTQWYAPLSAETNTAKTTVVDSETDAGKEVRVDVKLNPASDNLIRSTPNGLYAPGYTKAEIDSKFGGLSNYKHPTHTPHSKGFYKFANDGLGHVSDAEVVTKKDITDLGIPGEDTKYTLSRPESTDAAINVTLSGDKNSVTNINPYIKFTENEWQTTYELPLIYFPMSKPEENSLKPKEKIRQLYATDPTKIGMFLDGSGMGMSRLSVIDHLYIPSTIYTRYHEGSAYMSYSITFPKQNCTLASDKEATESEKGLMSAADKTKLDGIEEGANRYVHPNHTSHSKNFYKFANDGQGHVSGAEKVTKSDITALGIPGQDTTYGNATQSVSGLLSANDKKKLDAIEEGANKYVHPDVFGTRSQYGEISVNDFTISISNAPFKFGSIANVSQCGVPIENAEGNYSLCANAFTSTSECAEASSVFGYATRAGAKHQFVIGEYNEIDEGDINRADETYGIGKYAFIIGNGSGNAERSNAIAIAWDGNIYCYGDTISLNEQIDANTKKLSGIADNANNYVHPTTSGNKHIPSGGSSGQILRWSADGTAVWGKDNNTTYTAGTGLSMSGTTINHSNSVTAKTTADLIKVKHDAQGHITGTADVAASDVSALINKLTTAGSTPTDADYYICQYAGGGTTTTTYHRRPMSALWEYIKSKISSVLGLTASTYGGKSATATKLATACALKIGNTSKKFDGSADVTWTLAEIGAAAASHTHSQLHTHTTKSTNYGTLTASSNQLSLTSAVGVHTDGKTYTYNNTSYSGSSKSEVFNDYASNMAANDYAHVEGCNNKGLSNCFHVEGWNNVASGNQSHAEGQYCKATGVAAHAQNTSTTASGNYSHAEGWLSQASGEKSHAGGYDSKASGEGSFVHGYQCTATTPWSVAMGSICTSSNANCAFTFGWGLTNLIGNSTVVGQWNAQNNAGLFVVGKGTSSAKANAFRVASDGKTYATGAYSSTGADYAEMFEWLDGNPSRDDRRGHFVTLDGEKIKFAESADDDIIGVVSAAASIVGDAYEDGWNGMYLTDIFGGNLYDEPIIDEDGNEHTYQTLNPDYDPNVKYIPRSERPEWDAVGMMGKLVVVDDGTCQVNSYCVPTTGGIATKSDGRVGYRVLSRIDDTHVKILMR